MKRAKSQFLKIIAILVFGQNISAVASPYIFTNIADNRGLLNEFVGFTSNNIAINNSGTVAFFASLDAGGHAIFTGQGGPLTPVADDSGEFRVLGSAIDINNAGAVVFSAILPDDSHGLYVNRSGINTLLYSGSKGFPSINDSGIVSFWSSGGGLPSGIYRGDGSSPPTLIAQQIFPTLWPLSNTYPINNAGIVAFGATDTPFRSTITRWYTGSGDGLTLIADSSGPISETLQGDDPSINDTGMVFFSTRLDSGESAIFSGNGGPLNLVVDSTGAFSSFSHVNANNAGEIAFRASLDTGEFGIFGGNNTFGDIILVGDPLFDSTVTGLNIYSHSLNDEGQVAFVYTLADGRQGVARADAVAVPEPGTFTLLCMGLGLSIIPSVTRAYRRRLTAQEYRLSSTERGNGVRSPIAHYDAHGTGSCTRNEQNGVRSPIAPMNKTGSGLPLPR